MEFGWSESHLSNADLYIHVTDRSSIDFKNIGPIKAFYPITEIYEGIFF